MEEGLEAVAGGGGMHKTGRRGSSCQQELPVPVVGRRGRLLGRPSLTLSSSTCWEEQTITTIVGAAVTVTMEDPTIITSAGVTIVSHSETSMVTLMEHVRGQTTLDRGGVTLQDGTTRDVGTYSHPTGSRTIPGHTEPAHTMGSHSRIILK